MLLGRVVHGKFDRRDAGHVRGLPLAAKLLQPIILQGQRRAAKLGGEPGGGVGVGNDERAVLGHAGLEVQATDVEMAERKLLDQHDLDGVGWIACFFQELGSVDLEQIGAHTGSNRAADSDVKVGWCEQVLEVGGLGRKDFLGQRFWFGSGLGVGVAGTSSLLLGFRWRGICGLYLACEDVKLVFHGLYSGVSF